MSKGAEISQSNPLRIGLSTRAVPQPCALVIFGATGDLAHRKLIPALYNLAAAGELPPAVTVIGFARRPKKDDGFRDELADRHRTDKIHLLFNNAGISGGGSMVTNSRDEWERTFNICWGGV